MKILNVCIIYSPCEYGVEPPGSISHGVSKKYTAMVARHRDKFRNFEQLFCSKFQSKKMLYGQTSSSMFLFRTKLCLGIIYGNYGHTIHGFLSPRHGASPGLRMGEQASRYECQLRIYWISSRRQPTRSGPPSWGFGVRLTTSHCKNRLRSETSHRASESPCE